MTPHLAQVLAKGPLFQQLPPKLRQCLISKAQPRSYGRGAVICLQGEQARTLKLVLDGWVKLYRLSGSGEEAVLATLQAADSFDEVAALQGGISQASAEAVSPCTVLHLDLQAICACERAKEHLQAAVLHMASHHLDGMMAQVEGLKVQTGAQRLTRYLIDLYEAEGGAIEFELPFEKVILAGKLGMKPESLSRAFARLKPIGVSSSHRLVSIRDMSKLRAYAEATAA